MSSVPTGSRPDWPIEVFPVVIPQINWQTLIALTETHLGKSIMRRLNTEGIEPSIASYIQALGLMESPEVPPQDFLRYFQWKLLDALSMSFLVISDPGMLMAFSLQSRILYHGTKFGIFHATLKDWREAILAVCCKDSEMRPIGNRIFEYLEQAGFRDIFFGFRKEPLADGTFILCK